MKRAPMRAGHTKLDLGLQPGHFDDLAFYLRRRAHQDEFRNQSSRFGPLTIALSTSPECDDLDMGSALTAYTSPSANSDHLNNHLNHSPEAPTSKHSCEDPTVDLTVYVLDLSLGKLDSCLEPFLKDKRIPLQRLSNSGHAQQFITRDDQRLLLKVFDLKNQYGLLAYSSRERLPAWEIFSPIKEFIHLLALSQSCVLFHGASLVAADAYNQGTLIVGPGGSGKSTLTAYAIEHGMLTNGDDYVLVDLREDKPRCWSVYRTLKLHPTSPVLQSSQSWKAWRKDLLTGKSIMLAESVEHGGALLPQATLSSILGVSLIQSSEVYNPKASSIMSDPLRHPYLHTCMSTIQQIPYQIEATLALSKKLHQSIPYRTHRIKPGIQGLQEALLAVQGRSK